MRLAAQGAAQDAEGQADGAPVLLGGVHPQRRPRLDGARGPRAEGEPTRAGAAGARAWLCCAFEHKTDRVDRYHRKGGELACRNG